jgi:ABC-type Fe3+ transport system permease subunit
MAYGLIALIVLCTTAAIFLARYRSHKQVYRRQRRTSRDRDRKRDEG